MGPDSPAFLWMVCEAAASGIQLDLELFDLVEHLRSESREQRRDVRISRPLTNSFKGLLSLLNPMICATRYACCITGFLESVFDIGHRVPRPRYRSLRPGQKIHCSALSTKIAGKQHPLSAYVPLEHQDNSAAWTEFLTEQNQDNKTLMDFLQLHEISLEPDLYERAAHTIKLIEDGLDIPARKLLQEALMSGEHDMSNLVRYLSDYTQKLVGTLFTRWTAPHIV